MMRDTRYILLAEDDGDDQMLFKMACAQIITDLKLVIVSGGVQLLSYLDASKKELPSLIVLDYNMPLMNGADVIRAVYKQPEYASIPIVILSTSGSRQVVEDCLKEGALKCFVKPNTMDKLKATTKEILSLCGEKMEKIYDK